MKTKEYFIGQRLEIRHNGFSGPRVLYVEITDSWKNDAGETLYYFKQVDGTWTCKGTAAELTAVLVRK